MKNIIFLDIDGTLVNESGVVPESAKKAVQLARKNGHLVFLSTGRSKAEIFSHILDIGFDGVVGAAGGYVEIKNEVLFHEKIKKESIKNIVEYFDEKKIDFYLESNGGLFASKNCKNHLEEIIQKMILKDPLKKEQIKKGIQPFKDALVESENLIRDDVNKISFLGSITPFKEIKEKFLGEFNVLNGTVPVFGENSGELSVLGINKATAIEKLLTHLKLDKENTFAYGDALNDLEMLKYVKVGIAMGNAKKELKEIADDITDTHDENGIYNSFKKYCII